ncbi:MAG: homocysteine S-methyltransferase family protein, partial [Oscillospiraceae bacterium]|nr:homocysteine S-methyltransferase family protein [Oscillospiraceae bacterium]
GELYDAFSEQITALERGGADAVCIETMSDVDEALKAIEAAKRNTGLEIICSFTYELTARGEYRTMMGVSPVDAARACLAAGADVVGTNCGNGIERMVEIAKQIKNSEPDAFLFVQANAGLPQRVDGVDVFPDSPDFMAGFVNALIDVGANIIGGCCGTTPEHIAAIKAAIDGASQK